MKKKILFRSNFSERIVFISGLTRSGKSMLCPIISSLEKVENFHLINIVEEILKLNYSGFIKSEAVNHLIKTIINQVIYDNAIGRNFNFRKDDWTSIWKYKKPKSYLKRLLIKDQKILNNIKKIRTITPFMMHDGLIYLNIFFKNFPKLRMLHLQRNPIDLIYSWMKKKKEGKESSDPRHLYALFEVNKKVVPHHSIKYYKKYHTLKYKDRVIMVLNNLIKEHIKCFNLLTKKQKKKICFINFDDMVTNTKKELNKICIFLNTKNSSATNKILKRERCPRKIDFLLRKQKLNFIKKDISLNSLKILNKMIKQYESKKILI